MFDIIGDGQRVEVCEGNDGNNTPKSIQKEEYTTAWASAALQTWVYPARSAPNLAHFEFDAAEFRHHLGASSIWGYAQ